MATPAITSAPTATIGAIPLTTQFVGASQCRDNHLTMVGAIGDQVWLNEPFPASGLTSTDCYPTEIIASLAATTTLLPVFSPLICPDWYSTVSQWGDNYIACCPSSYTLHLTTGPTPPARSAFNATCFSNLPSLTTVTAYDSVEITSTQGYNDPTAQAYAHALDGYRPATARGGITVVAGPPPPADTASKGVSVSQAPFSDVSAGAAGSLPTQSSSNNLSGPAIAGVVVGAFAFCLLATLLAWIIFLLRRRRRDEHKQESFRDHKEKLQISHPSPFSSISAPTMSTVSPRSMSAPAPIARPHPRSRPSERTLQHHGERSFYKEGEAMNDAASSIADLGRASPTSIRGFDTVGSPETMQSPPPRFSHVVRQDRRRQQSAAAEMENRGPQRYELGNEVAPWVTARRKEEYRPGTGLVELPGDKPWRR